MLVTDRQISLSLLTAGCTQAYEQPILMLSEILRLSVDLSVHLHFPHAQ